MKAAIISIKSHPEGAEITAVVYWRHLPPPDYEGKETDEQYASRVASIAKDIDGFSNLHIGWAELKQKPNLMKIPFVEEYGS